MKNSKHKGLISQQNIISKLLDIGYSVSLPLGDNNEYDLIVDNGKKLLCLQCKTGIFNSKKGNITFNVTSTASNGKRKRYYYTKRIKYILVYTQNFPVLSIPYKIFSTKKASMVLRVKPTKNKQASNINNFTQFILHKLS